MKMKVYKKIMSGIMIICLLSTVTYAAEWSGIFDLWASEYMAGKTGNPFTNWYEVAEWEHKICFDWGGDSDPNAQFSESMVGDIYHDTIIALQAEVRDPLPDDFEAHLEERLFEVSWFVQPTQYEESLNFEVYIYDRYGASTLLASGTSNYLSGYRDYYATYSETNYTKAKIIYWNDRMDDFREVEIVGSEED